MLKHIIGGIFYRTKNNKTAHQRVHPDDFKAHTVHFKDLQHWVSMGSWMLSVSCEGALRPLE